MSFPTFSGLFPSLIAAAAAAPDEIPICKRHSYIIGLTNIKSLTDINFFTRSNHIALYIDQLKYFCMLGTGEANMIADGVTVS
jgi:hypothetical protein